MKPFHQAVRGAALGASSVSSAASSFASSSILRATLLLILSLLLASPHAFAGHPFITEDTNTQGHGGHQLEANTDWSQESESDSASHAATFVYSYGVRDNLDLYASLPLTITAPRGANDAALGAKWRFYESHGSSLALKPELRLPNGKQRAGQGTGRANLALTLIGMQEAGPWTLAANLGLASNHQALDSSEADARSLLWHASAALSWRWNPRWMALADLGIGRNPDAVGPNPAYLLSGLIYSPRPEIDLDAGIKFGLNHAVEQRQFGIGLSWRF